MRQMTRPDRLKVIIFFEKEDTQFLGDYIKVGIIINNDFSITYGDSYHDKGIEKSEGFVKAIQTYFPECSIDYLKCNIE